MVSPTHKHRHVTRCCPVDTAPENGSPHPAPWAPQGTPCPAPWKVRSCCLRVKSLAPRQPAVGGGERAAREQHASRSGTHRCRGGGSSRLQSPVALQPASARTTTWGTESRGGRWEGPRHCCVQAPWHIHSQRPAGTGRLIPQLRSLRPREVNSLVQTPRPSSFHHF